MVTTGASKKPRAPFRGLSIQQRLPLLIFVLLFLIIVSFSYISWLGVRNAAIRTGQARLVTLTNQLGDLFGQSAQALITGSQNAAKDSDIQQFILTGGDKNRSAAASALAKINNDRPNIMTILTDTNYLPLLYTSHDSVRVAGSLLELTNKKLDTGKIENLRSVKDSMYYPLISGIIHEKKLIGYLVRWRIQFSTSKSVAQFSQLLGTDASLYIGNGDGSLWTDMIRPVAKPTASLLSKDEFAHYKNGSGKRVIASINTIPKTNWVVLVEFSQRKMLETTYSYLRWVIIAGFILIAIGLAVTWIISRNITRPLHDLEAASSAIADGDYSAQVTIRGSDELSKLANSFNAMAAKVQESQQELENKVQQRTAQLEVINRELESFSYSISHDLRAPLRIIDGYAGILQNDFKDKLNDEGNRVLNVIKANAQRMGQLIDDLLDFSQLGRKELLKHTPDMNGMVAGVIDELVSKESPINISKGDLLSTECDSSLIRQVWINLIENAIKYSANNPSPQISIKSEKKEGEIIYTVKDNGVGFDMKYAGKLFGVFQRLHKDADFKGTGIGLALANRILQRHGGRIWANSEKGKGAEFSFALPS